MGAAPRPEVWLILPTYNEAANIGPLVAAAAAALADTGHAHRIVIVDDRSPDGTGAVADGLAAEHPEVEVIHRPVKDGLGRAYAAGFDRALDQGAEYVVEMDADFSHDPGDLPRLLAAAADGADLVLGSRYVPGGAIAGWTLPRRLVSRAGSTYARTLLGVGIRDLTGGFKCFRAETLRRISYRSAHSHGYAFQIEMTYRTLELGHRVVEIPICFHDRRAGASKMTIRIALEAVVRVPAMRAHRLRAQARRRLGGRRAA